MSESKDEKSGGGAPPGRDSWLDLLRLVTAMPKAEAARALAATAAFCEVGPEVIAHLQTCPMCGGPIEPKRVP